MSIDSASSSCSVVIDVPHTSFNCFNFFVSFSKAAFRHARILPLRLRRLKRTGTLCRWVMKVMEAQMVRYCSRLHRTTHNPVAPFTYFTCSEGRLDASPCSPKLVRRLSCIALLRTAVVKRESSNVCPSDTISRTRYLLLNSTMLWFFSHFFCSLFSSPHTDTHKKFLPYSLPERGRVQCCCSMSSLKALNRNPRLLQFPLQLSIS